MRLIDADALIPWIKNGEMNEYTEFGQGYNSGIAFAVKTIKNAPTIDPAKHEYCSRCGAKMDGDEV